MTHIYKLLLPESSKNSTFILQNSPIIRYSTQGRVIGLRVELLDLDPSILLFGFDST